MEKSLALQHPMTKRDPTASGAMGLDCIPPNGLTPPLDAPWYHDLPQTRLFCRHCSLACLSPTWWIYFSFPDSTLTQLGAWELRLPLTVTPSARPITRFCRRCHLLPVTSCLLLCALQATPLPGFSLPWRPADRGPRGEDPRPTPPAWPRLPCPTCRRPSASPPHHTSPNLNGCRPPPTRLRIALTDVP